MRRELSLVGASIVVYTCALVLGTFVICGTGHASAVVGEWATQGNAAHVRSERCSTAPESLCGLVTWLWEPIDAEGEPVRDKHNPDSRLRVRTVVGVSLLEDFRGGANGEALEGRIYNPENGRTYRATLKLRSPDILEVKGCLLIVCDTQVWRRVESLCGMPPTPYGLNASTETLLTPNFLLAPRALSEMN
jgi:uncharacterized protein (DUF2147 family)